MPRKAQPWPGAPLKTTPQAPSGAWGIVLQGISWAVPPPSFAGGLTTAKRAPQRPFYDCLVDFEILFCECVFVQLRGLWGHALRWIVDIAFAPILQRNDSVFDTDRLLIVYLLRLGAIRTTGLDFFAEQHWSTSPFSVYFHQYTLFYSLFPVFFRNFCKNHK